MTTKHKLFIFLAISLVLLVFLFIGAINYVLYLQQAHSSFQNYYAFRGCTQLLEKTDSYGTCRTQSGDVIKIVKYQNKWYLDGDLPQCAIHWSSICLVNWP